MGSRQGISRKVRPVATNPEVSLRQLPVPHPAATAHWSLPVAIGTMLSNDVGADAEAIGDLAAGMPSGFRGATNHTQAAHQLAPPRYWPLHNRAIGTACVGTRGHFDNATESAGQQADLKSDNTQ